MLKAKMVIKGTRESISIAILAFSDRLGLWGSSLSVALCLRSLDGPIRANRFADSRGSPDSRKSFQSSRTEPLSSGQKIANRKFEAIRANRSNVMKIGGFSANRFTRIATVQVANRRAI